MLELSRIREEKDAIAAGLKIRNLDVKDQLEAVISLDEKRRETQQQMERDLAELNSLAKSIGGLFKEGKVDEANAMKTKTSSSWSILIII